MVDEGLYKKGGEQPTGDFVRLQRRLSILYTFSSDTEVCVCLSSHSNRSLCTRLYGLLAGLARSKDIPDRKKRRRRKSGAGGCSRLLTHTMWARTVFVLSIRLLLLVISSLRKKKKERNAQLGNCQNRYCVTQSLQHTENSFVWDLVAEEEEEKTDRCQVGGKGVKEAPNWAWNAVRQHRVFWVMDSTLRPVSWRNVSRQLASSAPPSAPVA